MNVTLARATAPRESTWRSGHRSDIGQDADPGIPPLEGEELKQAVLALEQTERDRREELERLRERHRASGSSLTFEEWHQEFCAAEYGRATENTERERRERTDREHRAFASLILDDEIRFGRITPPASPAHRRVMVTYTAMNGAGRTLAAEVYLRRVQRRMRNPRRQARQLQILSRCVRPSQRTTRSRRSPTTGRPTGDPGDGDPPEPPGNRRCLPAEVAP